MIFGVGIDITEVDRIAKLLRENGKRFIERIAHPADKKAAPRHAAHRAEYWAARFAAKEAFAKALGTGIGKTLAFTSVGISRGTSGKPAVVCTPALSRELKKRRISRIHVTLTHSANTAIAVVILEQDLIKS